MSDQQQENEITTTAAPTAPATSDQVVKPAPVQASAPEASKATPAAAPAAVESASPAPFAAGDEAAPAKTKRTRRASKPAAEGEEAVKPKRRTTRTTRTKRTVAADPAASISDEVAQARALAQISEAQVVRARRRAAEREAAALTELAAPSAPEANATAEARVTGPSAERPAARTRRRVAAKAQQPVEQGASDAAEAPTRPVAGESAQSVEPVMSADASAAPVVDPALRPHRRGRKPKAFVEAEKAAAAAAAAAQGTAVANEPTVVADTPVQDAAVTESAAEGEPADVRPGRSRRSASKRSTKAKGAKKDASEDAANEVAGATSDVAPETENSDQPAAEKPKRTRKKSEKAKAAEHQTDADAASAIDGKFDGEASNNTDAAAADGTAPAESDEGNRPNRRQHKRNDERSERNNDRRNRQRDRKQRNKERNAAPTEPTLSREELAAMKVAELREKAKEFEIETTGKKKAELVEEIYTTAAKAEGFRDIKGILQIRPDSSGIIHAHGYMKSHDDAFVPAYLIRSARLRTGDVIEGSLRPSRGGDKRAGLAKITTVNGLDPEQARNRPKFGDLTPVYPNEPLRMEHGKDSITGRAIDIVSPIGKGQRGLIVSPPKAGKTTILKKICQSISINNPEVHLICLLVDERPEEVTDMQRSIKGEVVASTFDMPADNHTRVAELVIERAKRIVELGGDVVVVLDSITRLARAYNLAAPASGRILSGGVDSAALYPPKRFLGAARNIENGGSLTILASALIDTGSKMDEVIFEEFKGTGNMELKLDRDLADRRIFPAIDPVASGTRNEDLLVDEQMRPFVFGLRRILAGMNNTERAAASFIKGLKGTNTNQEFLVRSAKKHSDYEQTF